MRGQGDGWIRRGDGERTVSDGRVRPVARGSGID